ncbi:hypothetical protein PHLCEN_2v7055 [Hermanssonia centrifuga]|uniref:Nicotinate phosphoribosyltransferase n=1 Tax=Hermanssonia centrifuga TaxID=98765 RepID=A0A2R6NYA1_9APHY|nr:hypothetical protein PHLCEN_2v7055 [Hermanssonia centrifuga]
MQQAVLRHFPEVQAVYRFKHRDEGVFFTRRCFNLFVESVKRASPKLPIYLPNGTRNSYVQLTSYPDFHELTISLDERDWLAGACPFFSPEYLDYLSSYRFKPSQVKATFNAKPGDDNLGRIEIDARGPWVETILWEVPLMACLSEIYFTTVDTDWSYDGQVEQAYEKAKTFLGADCMFSEFGTRRRRSFHAQDLVVSTLVRASKELAEKGKFMGTSNVHLAWKHQVLPIGTIAHEWYMAIGALKGYEHVNGVALDIWENVYPNSLLLALTDTFSTEAFYKDFVSDKARAERWKGLRQDSGDPMIYAPRAKEIYESLGIDWREKTIIFSDSLNVEKVLKLRKQCEELGFKATFGIGTSFTNDFHSTSSGGNQKSKALNMVIKLAEVDGKPCVKISDELTKNTGDPVVVKQVKQIFNIHV